MRRLGGIAAALLGLCDARAAAQAPTALSWVRDAGAESCIGAPELGARVERLVGPVLVSAPSGQVSVEGRIARRGARYVATIAVSDARGALLGERVVEGLAAAAGQEPDCRALDDQLAFVIAVAIDPNAALAELPGELAPEGDPGAQLLADLRASPPQPVKLAAAPPRQDERESTTRRPDEDGPAFRAALAAGWRVGGGMLPRASSGPSFELGVGLGFLVQRARIALALPQTERAETASVELGWLELGTSTCAVLELASVPRLELDLCAGAAFAQLTAAPRGFPGTAQDPWLFGPRADVRVAWLFAAPFSLVLDAGLASFWPKHRVLYESAGRPRQVHEVASISPTAALLLEARL